MAHSAGDQGREAASQQMEYLSRLALDSLPSHSWEAARRLGQIWAAQHTPSGSGRAATRASCAHDGDEGVVTKPVSHVRTARPGRQPETAQNGPLMNTRQRLVPGEASGSVFGVFFCRCTWPIQEPVGFATSLSCYLSACITVQSVDSQGKKKKNVSADTPGIKTTKMTL